MAAHDREILREFLVALGYQVDNVGARKFQDALSGASKTAARASAIIAAVGVAAEVMVTKFSRSMEKLYYASERTGAAVKNIQALEYGAEQIGIKGEDARQVLESLSRSLRLNPGLVALLNSLGVQTTGRDRVDVLRDLIAQLSKMPHYVGAQYAQMFGIDEQTFFHMKRWFDELNAAQKERLELQQRAGFDAQEAAKMSREYANELRAVWERVEVLSQALGIKLLPYFKEFSGIVKGLLDDLMQLDGSLDLDMLGEWGQQSKEIYNDLDQIVKWIQWLINTDIAKTLFGTGFLIISQHAHMLLDVINAITALMVGDLPRAAAKMRSAFGRLALPGGVFEDDGTTDTWLQRFARRIGGDKHMAPAERQAEASGDWPTTESMVDKFLSRGGQTLGSLRDIATQAARTYGIPPALFHALIKKESNWNQLDPNTGRILTSSAGALGLSQLMPSTARGLGVDPSNATQNIQGGARYLAQMFAQFGNWRDALAAYNAGPNSGLTAGYGYADSIMRNSGVNFSQTTNITVNGAGSPADTARDVSRAQTRVNGDVVRNLQGVVR